MRYEVNAMPTFLFFKNREKIHQVLKLSTVCVLMNECMHLTRYEVLMKQLLSRASFSILGLMLSQQGQLPSPAKCQFLDR